MNKLEENKIIATVHKGNSSSVERKSMCPNWLFSGKSITAVGRAGGYSRREK
jgi:hypothetical protein